MVDEENKRQIKENFELIFTSFGQALSEIFNDPELKAKARQFGSSAAESASTFADRFKDDEVRAKFKQMAQAAKDFGSGMATFGQDVANRFAGKDKKSGG
jgi:ribosomal-protein-alanine N-acetyltransferase